MKDTVIVSSARTAFGRMQGSLSGFSAVDLGAIAIAEAVKRAGIDPELVDCTIMGQVLTAGCGQVPARQASIKGGLPKKTWAINVNKVCISSMSALEQADMMIKLGQAEVLVVGGMESMTNAPYSVPKARGGYRMGNGTTGGPDDQRRPVGRLRGHPHGQGHRQVVGGVRRQARADGPSGRPAAISVRRRRRRPAGWTKRSCRWRSPRRRATRSSSPRTRACAPTPASRSWRP